MKSLMMMIKTTTKGVTKSIFYTFPYRPLSLYQIDGYDTEKVDQKLLM
jgi:hypothetical protein